MTLGFDCRSCGLGDVIVSLWIAQGARAEGHETLYLPGQHDWVVRAFGFEPQAFDIADVDGTASFGGESPGYRRELDLGGRGAHRGHLWQHELPITVEPQRPIAGRWEECDEWAADLKAARTGGTKPFVLIFPACAYNTRTWPEQKWIRLAWGLEANGVGTAALNSSPQSIEAMPFYAYGYSVEAIISLMRVADLVIANDSGPAHLAGTLGMPTIAIMGPTDPATVFGYCPDVECLHVSEAELACVGCHFKANRGFNAACDRGCEALGLLSARTVFDRVLQRLEIPARATRPDLVGRTPLLSAHEASSWTWDPVRPCEPPTSGGIEPRFPVDTPFPVHPLVWHPVRTRIDAGRAPEGRVVGVEYTYDYQPASEEFQRALGPEDVVWVPLYDGTIDSPAEDLATRRRCEYEANVRAISEIGPRVRAILVGNANAEIRFAEGSYAHAHERCLDFVARHCELIGPETRPAFAPVFEILVYDCFRGDGALRDLLNAHRALLLSYAGCSWLVEERGDHPRLPEPRPYPALSEYIRSMEAWSGVGTMRGLRAGSGAELKAMGFSAGIAGWF